MPAKQNKRWTFTLNNYTEADITAIQALYAAQHVSFIIYGKEIAPETQTPHLQGYVEFPTKRSAGGVKRLISNRAHVEIARMTAIANINYCRKTRPEDPVPNAEVYEAGTAKSPVLHGNDAADELNRLLRAGASLKEIAESNPFLFCRLHRGIDRYIQVTTSRPRNFKTQVYVYEGASGTGKTRRAWEKDQVEWVHANDRWFDGYLNHDRILFDDFDGVNSGITYRKLLHLLDRYQMQVPVKGGFANFSPRICVITTNIPPNQWYPTESWPEIERRIGLHMRFQAETIQVVKGEPPEDLVHLGDDFYFNPYFE